MNDTITAEMCSQLTLEDCDDMRGHLDARMEELHREENEHKTPISPADGSFLRRATIQAENRRLHGEEIAALFRLACKLEYIAGHQPEDGGDLGDASITITGYPSNVKIRVENCSIKSSEAKPLMDLGEPTGKAAEDHACGSLVDMLHEAMRLYNIGARGRADAVIARVIAAIEEPSEPTNDRKLCSSSCKHWKGKCGQPNTEANFQCDEYEDPSNDTRRICSTGCRFHSMGLDSCGGQSGKPCQSFEEPSE